MPHILVVADGETREDSGAVMLRERITADDLESGHFARHLLERLNWAVGDAHAAERDATDTGPEASPTNVATARRTNPKTDPTERRAAQRARAQAALDAVSPRPGS
jgi:hypothetical protein